MTFAYPLGLIGLLSIPAVFVLHLMRERRNRYTVSSLQLWSFLKEEVRGSLPRRVPLSWLLVVDLLIAAVLSFAWANPQIPTRSPVSGARQFILLLDVSTSMLARDGSPTRFAAAQEQALAVLGSLGPRDVASVLAFGAGSRLVGDTRQIGLYELMDRVRALQAGETGHSLDEALASAQALADTRLPVEVQVYTDEAYPVPTYALKDIPVSWRPFGSSENNQAVLNVSALHLESGQLQVFARFANFSASPSNRSATLLLDGSPVDSLSIDMNPTSTITRLWTVSADPTTVSVQLAGSDALPEDDQAVTILKTSSEVRALLVASDPEPVGQALRSVPGVHLRVVQPSAYHPGSGDDLTIFRGFLPEVWPSGAVLVLDPPENSPLFPLTGKSDLQGQPVPDPNGLLAGVDFSGVQWGTVWRAENPGGAFTPLLETDKQPILLYGRADSSRVYVLLSDLRSGNLTRHPAFPILIASLLQESRSEGWPISLQAGRPLVLPPSGAYASLRVTLPNGKNQEWGGSYPESFTQTYLPGIYTLDTVDQNGAKAQARVGVNAGDLAESSIKPQSWGLDSGSMPAVAVDMQSTSLSLQPWLLGLAGLLLLVEAWLAWR